MKHELDEWLCVDLTLVWLWVWIVKLSWFFFLAWRNV